MVRGIGLGSSLDWPWVPLDSLWVLPELPRALQPLDRPSPAQKRALRCQICSGHQKTNIAAPPLHPSVGPLTLGREREREREQMTSWGRQLWIALTRAQKRFIVVRLPLLHIIKGVVVYDGKIVRVFEWQSVSGRLPHFLATVAWVPYSRPCKEKVLRSG